MVQVIGRFRASILRGLPLVKVGLFSGEIYHRFVAQTWKGALLSYDVPTVKVLHKSVLRTSGDINLSYLQIAKRHIMKRCQ
ncbi:TPA: hypothetical protein I7784_20630 [Vibrio vulnificus]|nr:hypothetical protein [Vibrio vulnificus]